MSQPLLGDLRTLCLLSMPLASEGGLLCRMPLGKGTLARHKAWRSRVGLGEPTIRCWRPWLNCGRRAQAGTAELNQANGSLDSKFSQQNWKNGNLTYPF